ncbi:hypothetical protein BDZ97DRAFT_1922988 [Flammula alnicola]|nr:hypothetical protein BDZ97DRAFT_1928270 [Flammula alnicola]KAF8959294.1 hypothetical protein BDZ97DRAFT_1922988 [Flammula alnicola]
MFSPGRPNYEHHAGFYRSINPGHDLSKPWEGSPISTRSLPESPLKPVFDLPKRNQSIPSTSTVSVVKVPVARRKGLWRCILRFIRSGSVSSGKDVIAPFLGSPEPENPYSEKVPLHEWKQYGYWARPYLNDVLCENSPVTSEKSISTEALADLITNLRGPEEYDVHPERWVVGTKHRALPQRPARWKDPVPGEPFPFPWEVQLNPLLHHPIWGPAPLSWCIWANPYTNLYYGRTPLTVRCTDPDRQQPATWPFLTHMHFNAVLGDHAYKFPWPFTVCNPRGIKVGDILAEIHYQFQQPVTEDERSSWVLVRQEAARRTFQQRCNNGISLGQPPLVDVMRRCDALGAQMWFRGIEPSVDGGGWMISFGTY